MYYRFDITGCLTLLIILFLFLFLFPRLWWFFAVIVLIYIINTYIAAFRQKMAEKKTQQDTFKPEMGQSYKVCPYCGEKVQVTELRCPKCGRELG